MENFRQMLMYSTRQLFFVAIALIAIFSGHILSILLIENTSKTLEMAVEMLYLLFAFTVTNMDLAIMFNYSRKKIVKTQLFTSTISGIFAYIICVGFAKLAGVEIQLFQHAVANSLDYFVLFIIIVSVAIISMSIFLTAKLAPTIPKAAMRLFSMLTIVLIYSSSLMVFYTNIILYQESILLAITMIVIPVVIMSFGAYKWTKRTLLHFDLCNQLKY